jgi:hypothetical protein
MAWKRTHAPVESDSNVECSMTDETPPSLPIDDDPARWTMRKAQLALELELILAQNPELRKSADRARADELAGNCEQTWSIDELAEDGSDLPE